MTQTKFASSARPMDAFMAATETTSGPIRRIAIVSDSLPERNGVGAYYCDLLDQLRTAGYEATLLSPSAERWTLLQFPLPGDATQRIWIPSPLRFRRVLKKLQPELVIAATPGPYGLLGAWWARRLDAQLIFGFHTHYSGVTELYRNRFLRSFSRFYFSVADAILFRTSDLVLANSRSMVDLALSLGAKRADVMGTLLPPSALQPAVTPVRPRLERVLFAGRLAPEKRVDTVIDAARELPDIHFRIAGDGPLRRDIEKAAARLPNVEVLGWLSRQSLLLELDLADLLVLPSVLESFGTVALEAMARERLALVSAACGIVDWPELANSLYRIAPGETTADAIRRVAALPSDVRAATARSARRVALDLNRQSLRHWIELSRVKQTGHASA